MDEKWLSLLPAIVSCIFIAVFFLRLLQLRTESNKLIDGHHGFHKLVRPLPRLQMAQNNLTHLKASPLLQRWRRCN